MKKVVLLLVISLLIMAFLQLDTRRQVKVHQDGMSLVAIVSSGNFALLKQQLEKGVNPNQVSPYDDGYTALHMAAQMGKIEFVTLLLDKGADLNLLTRDGFTAKELALKGGHASVAKLLSSHPSIGVP